MITIEINAISMIFNTTATLFSPNSLDNGTRAMLSCAQFTKTDKVLDLGCGYGVVGIYIAKLIGEENVTMVDIDDMVVNIARENAKQNGVPGIRIVQSDGFNNLDERGYTIILSNPPYHSDFSVAKHFIEKGFNRLAIGGKMLMVTKRKDWYKNKLISIFGGVSIKEIDGYFVFTAEKRNANYAKNAKK
jgi:16S rRNA (guanine1207-N2)-methyltransferase